ncbi:hypothetical protein PSTEL_09680 [Paenibacillus stellifer]|uniref:Uncharacterized protein n=1 Tax=Paenibacillus stellifer TaxID=169760 RepID=A0A089LP43_9BACL|nr:hypothetical protein [Paenibacillus stellifer]AIQ63316.1 hypothetical protein PSTEL_09680 [Paenibacillus stellifer]
MATSTQKKVKTKSGKEYLLQHPGVRNVTKISDRIKNKFGVPSDEKLATEMLTHVIVDPKLTIDSFDSYKELNDIVTRAYAFVTENEDLLDDDTDDVDED